MAGGKLLHGLVHPEFGHMRIPHDREADPFARRLPVPRRLLGRARVGRGRSRPAGGGRADELSDGHAAWELAGALPRPRPGVA